MSYTYETQYNSPNYQKGRPAGAPAFIVIHHWGIDGQKHHNVVSYLCRKGGNSSAHYVASAGIVTCIVDPDDRAWHAGKTGNPRGIGIECRPECSDGDFRTVAELIAKLRKTYGNLPLVGHKDHMNTDCPGRWYNRLQELSNLANNIKGGTSTPALAPSPAPSVNLEALATAVIAGKYGNGEARKRALGSNYAAVQAIVNKRLTGKSKPAPSVNLEALATAVIAGKYGNGEARKRALGSNYAAVQTIVNKRLRG